uniref:Uncharacterized protein n=1 Tax=Monopterus albus TaxID=43700 RepID=A0A3Q3K9I4_MONAL
MSYVFINDSSQTNVPLLQACIDGDLPFSKRLLETGCDPNIRAFTAARGNVDICLALYLLKFDLDYLYLCTCCVVLHCSNHNGSTPLVLAKRRGVSKDAIRLLEGLEEQEVKGFNRGPHSKLETMQMADSERTNWRSFREKGCEL